MEALFQPIELEWRGQKVRLAPDRVMKAIAIVESVVTLYELAAELASGRYQLARLAEAHAALLRYAGVAVGAEEVYRAIYPVGGGEERVRAASACLTLLMLMTPPGALKMDAPAGEAGAQAAGKSSPRHEPAPAS